MYNTIRCILVGLFIIGVVVLFRKKIIFKNIKSLVGAVVLLIICLYSFPPENYVYSFRSPEDAYYYVHGDCRVHTINGQNSSMVIPLGSGYDEFFTQKNDGWKLRNINTVKFGKREKYDDLTYQFISCGNDYYVCLSGANLSSIADNKGSDFYITEQSVFEDCVIVSGFAYVKDITDYELIIDGKMIKIT